MIFNPHPQVVLGWRVCLQDWLQPGIPDSACAGLSTSVSCRLKWPWQHSMSLPGQ